MNDLIPAYREAIAENIRADALARAQIKAKADESLAGKVEAESNRVEKGREYE